MIFFRRESTTREVRATEDEAIAVDAGPPPLSIKTRWHPAAGDEIGLLVSTSHVSAPISGIEFPCLDLQDTF